MLLINIILNYLSKERKLLWILYIRKKNKKDLRQNSNYSRIKIIIDCIM